MKNFIDKDFLLSTATAKTLYHEFAAKKPIVDYHCHIQPKEIAENKNFENITRLWLGGDHYKWRLMRADGVNEKYITGDASDWDKFQKWAQTLEKAIGNPIYHWSHLELQRYFNYDKPLTYENAKEVWDLCNEKLKDPKMSPKEIIRQSNVRLICTTDDPISSLRWHSYIREDRSFDIQILPAWRPDKAMDIESPGFSDYIKDLSKVSGISISSFSDFKNALKIRMKFFYEMGAKACDHAVEFAYRPAEDLEIEKIFTSKMKGGIISKEEALKYKTAFMLFSAKEYNKLGWVMEIHASCKRDNNKKAFAKLGPNTGYDCISSYSPTDELADLLNALEESGDLPKTIIYSLNPIDDDAINSIAGCFCKESILNRVQQGSAWWFNDHKTGMIKQITAFANGTLLANFIGMLTDSRSFISYPRHEYFRRILCDIIGNWVENGEYPNDKAKLGKIVDDISYDNAVKFFGFSL
jgi:glucuronate isomerase